MKLIDRHNRHLNYLRISITDRCNLRCLYCVPEDRIPKLKHEDILSYEEILRIVNVAVNLGITKIRITGGEPLVRKGVYRFLGQLSALNKLKDISLTTNGVLLKENLTKIKNCGIKRINISLDSLEPKKFKMITGYDHFDQTWQAILKAHELGFAPIKINVVALRGINEDELVKFARLSEAYPFHIRFIEYMPVGFSRFRAPDKHLLTPEIKNRLEDALGPLHPVPKGINDGPAKRYRLDGAPGEIGFISAVSHHFCSQCNRLRLTASGQLRACLLSDRQDDLKGPLRAGVSDQELAAIFLQATAHKAAHHHLAEKSKDAEIHDQMSGIGG